MSLAANFHDLIVKYNILTRPTDELNEYFAYHPNVFKVALLVNHLFRAAAMAGLLMNLPLSFPASLAICAASSLFYRLTVEPNCAYKFALPALGGAIALHIGETALDDLISGAALTSLEVFTNAFIPLIPLGMYAAYVILTVDYDVDHRPCPFCIANDG